jgi:hypothetical protein
MEKPILKSEQYRIASEQLIQISKDVLSDDDIVGLGLRYEDRSTTLIRRFDNQDAYRKIAKSISEQAIVEANQFKALITPDLVASDDKLWEEYFNSLSDSEKERAVK